MKTVAWSQTGKNRGLLMTDAMKNRRFDIRLSDNELAMLQVIAADMNRTQSDTMRQLIREAYQKLQEKKQ